MRRRVEVGAVYLHAFGERIQGAHSSGRDADQQLLRADLDEHSSFFRSERDIGEDLNRTAAGSAEITQSANEPRSGKHSCEHHDQ